MHLVHPPKFCTTIVSNFSWVTQSSQEKLKTTIVLFLWGGGGVNKVHYGLCENGDILVTDGNEAEVDLVFIQPFHVNYVVY